MLPILFGFSLRERLGRNFIGLLNSTIYLIICGSLLRSSDRTFIFSGETLNTDSQKYPPFCLFIGYANLRDASWHIDASILPPRASIFAFTLALKGSTSAELTDEASMKWRVYCFLIASSMSMSYQVSTGYGNLSNDMIGFGYGFYRKIHVPRI